MTCQGSTKGRPARRLALAAALSACLAAPAPALGAVAAKGGEDGLTPVLAKLARPSVQAQSRVTQAATLDVAAHGPGSLLREGGRVLVNVRFAGGVAPRLDGVREAGGRVQGASGRYRTATVSIAPADLPELAAAPGVAAVWPSRQPVTYGCEGGAVISEGLDQLGVAETRSTYGLRGAGTTVGVLSDSFDTAVEAADGSGPVATHARQDIETNDLPGEAGTCVGQQEPVDVLEEGPAAQGDEGRAMLQIVHDLAPHARLAFATAFQSEESFAKNIERLAEPVGAGGSGAQVLVDDVSWFEEPFFQDGPIADAVNKVTEGGATYLTAAGNDNLFNAEGDEIGSWEAPGYRDAGSCPLAIVQLSEAFELAEEEKGLTPVGLHPTHCMDFNPSEETTDRTFAITVEPGETLTLDLQWAEPWDGVSTDLDAYLLNGANEVVAGSLDLNVGKGGTQRPVEIPQWENTSASSRTVRLVINRFEGTSDPLLKFILLENGGGVSQTEYPKSTGGDVVGPTIFGHAGAASAISLAAVPFSNSSTPEPYSSRGPVTHYFAPVSGGVPAEPLTTPEVVAKPDVAATDCGATTFFAHLFDHWRFCGTSAAAPHAAAVAALLRQADPAASTQQIRDSLVETAAPVGAFGPEAVGAGLVDSLAAMASLPEPIQGGDGPSGELPSNGGEGPSVPASPPGTNQVQPPSVAPNTFIERHPPKLVRTASRSVRLGFRFGADLPVSGFLCRIDRRAFRACGASFSTRYALGAHTLRVRARGTDGLLDQTAAVFRFRVKRRG